MSAPSDLLDLGAVGLDTFSPHVDTVFTHAEHGEWAFTLTKAEAVGSAPPGGRAPFALVFQGPPNGPQGTWPLTHPALGPMHLFLVPVAADRYEAVFS